MFTWFGIAMSTSVFCCRITEEHYFKYASNILRKRSRSQDSSEERDEADAEIITEERSLLQQFFKSITKMKNNG